MPASGTNVRGVILVGLVSYLFFLLTLSVNFSASHDSISYLLHITRGESLFHQHHLLYHFFASRWLQGLRHLLPGIPAYTLIESFTALWGSATLIMCYLILRNRFYCTRALSIAGVCLIAFSYGCWMYSINIEVYLPPAFFILSCLYVISREKVEKNDVLLVTILHATAILFHQVNILFAPVVLWWLIQRRQVPLGRALLTYSLLGIAITGGVYFLIGWVIEGRQDHEFLRWVLGYTSGHDYWQWPSWQTPLKIAAGFGRAFIGAHFLFRLPLVAGFIQEQFAGHGLTDELFLVSHMPVSLAYILTVLTLLFFLFLAIMIIRLLWRCGKITMLQPVLTPLTLTLIVYSLFFVFWMPEIPDFWLLQMIMLWLMLTGTIPVVRLAFGIPVRAGLMSLVILLFVINYSGSIRWIQDGKYDWYRQQTLQLGKLTEKDLVIVRDEWILKDYIRYFTPARVIATDEPDYNESLAERASATARERGGKIIIIPDDLNFKKP